MQKMNVMLAVLVATLSTTTCAKSAEMKHPIRHEIVDEIKLKATSWKPKEVEDNHLRHRSPESLKASMGHLGTS